MSSTSTSRYSKKKEVGTDTRRAEKLAPFDDSTAGSGSTFLLSS